MVYDPRPVVNAASQVSLRELELIAEQAALAQATRIGSGCYELGNGQSTWVSPAVVTPGDLAPNPGGSTVPFGPNDTLDFNGSTILIGPKPVVIEPAPNSPTATWLTLQVPTFVGPAPIPIPQFLLPPIGPWVLPWPQFGLGAPNPGAGLGLPGLIQGGLQIPWPNLWLPPLPGWPGFAWPQWGFPALLEIDQQGGPLVGIGTPVLDADQQADLLGIGAPQCRLYNATAGSLQYVADSTAVGYTLAPGYSLIGLPPAVSGFVQTIGPGQDLILTWISGSSQTPGFWLVTGGSALAATLAAGAAAVGAAAQASANLALAEIAAIPLVTASGDASGTETSGGSLALTLASVTTAESSVLMALAALSWDAKGRIDGLTQYAVPSAAGPPAYSGVNGLVVGNPVDGKVYVYSTAKGTWTAVATTSTGEAIDFAPSTGFAFAVGNLVTALKTAAFSVSVWVKSVGGTVSIAAEPEGAQDDGRGWQLAPTSTSVIWNLGNASGTFTALTASGLTLNDGAWHHVVGTYDGTNSDIWVDGVSKASASPGITIQWADKSGDGPVPAALYIDAGHNSHNTGQTTTVDISGNAAVIMDELQIYNVALTSGNVATLYNGGAGSATALSGCVAQFHFDGNVNDAQGNLSMSIFTSGAGTATYVTGLL